jgi:hypothetical protein
MTSNYPDGVSESTPDAPWNQPDAVFCDECGEQLREVCVSCDEPCCTNIECDASGARGQCAECDR